MTAITLLAGSARVPGADSLVPRLPVLLLLDSHDGDKVEHEIVNEHALHRRQGENHDQQDPQSKVPVHLRVPMGFAFSVSWAHGAQ